MNILKKIGEYIFPIIATSAVVFSSCSLLPNAINEASKHVSISWSADSTSGKPIDSLVIKFDPVKWKDTVKTPIEIERNYSIGGYRIWQLSTPIGTRYEIQKIDTVIYFYEKRK